ncbi:MAG TPA: alpha-glucosidase C-terminal domain-containing protein [Ruminiclostridium sp.]|nr:alpha-glucosidase C-terminal domain-containing protein [Ruminiclostridium sp.]
MKKYEGIIFDLDGVICHTDHYHYRDLETLNAYEELVNKQDVGKETVMKYIHRISRDNARTPMQWNDGLNAGFSTSAPWIAVNPNYLRINAKCEINDPDSIYSYYKKLIRIRKENPIITEGRYELFDEDNKNIFAYLRTLNREKLAVLCNYSEIPSEILLPEDFKGTDYKLLISNYSDAKICKSMLLRPYEALAFLYR